MRLICRFGILRRDSVITPLLLFTLTCWVHVLACLRPTHVATLRYCVALRVARTKGRCSMFPLPGVGLMSINDKAGSGDLLRCPLCGNSFETPPRNTGGNVKIDLSFSHVPKILAGCLHTICQSCAEDALQRSSIPSAIPCPICRLVTTGISTTDGLTNNILVLQEVQRRSKQCDYCDDVVNATHRCIECKSLLCPFHVKSHARSRGTKAHSIFLLRENNRGIGGGVAATGIVRRLPLSCPRHAGAPAKLFCSEPCGTLLCHDCSVADHSGHSIFLADSEEVEVIHRTGLTRRVIDLGHRLAEVQGAVEAVEAVKAGVEQSTKMAEKAAAQAFSNLRRAIDFRERTMLKKMRGARISKAQDLKAQLTALEQLTRAYTSAMETTSVCLEKLRGDHLLAMEPDLRKCMDKHEADFQSLALDPCVDDHVEFAHDRDVGNALRLGISKYGCLASVNGPQNKKAQPPEEVVGSATRDVHFTLAAVTESNKKKATANPSDIVVVEMRSGSEQDFFKTGIEGPLIGRVVLHTRLQGTKYLTFESEDFLESLSHQVMSDKAQSFSDGIPTVRFTKTIRFSGRNGERPNLRR